MRTVPVMEYDHASHAGNAGDLWKHFILLEVADFLLSKPGDWIYVESHAGSPEYSLKPKFPTQKPKPAPCGHMDSKILTILGRNHPHFNN